MNEQWKVDFYKLKLGRPHHMKFGARSGQQAAYGTEARRLAGR